MKRSIISLLLLFCFISSWAQINDTYWRDDKTGDWLLGITDKNIIYDCKIWDISSMNEKKGSFSITATNSGQQIALNISKEKDSQRTITINKQKHVCSLITSEFLPDYPEKDTRKDFADNHYCKGDSVTIVGWIRNIPAKVKDKLKAFELYGMRNLAIKDISPSAKIDSLGRFTLRMPIENTTFCFNGMATFIVEPNETYLMLKDLKSKQTLFMGKNARVLNEINHYDIHLETTDYSHIKDFDAMAFLAKNDSLKNVAIQQLDSICNEHPTLSARFRTFRKNNILSYVAFVLMQGRFNTPEAIVPDEYLRVVTEEYFKKIQSPYACGFFDLFWRDYSDDIETVLRKSDENSIKRLMYSAEKDGIVKLSDKDKEDIDQYDVEYKILMEKLGNITDEATRKALEDEFDAKDFIKTINKLFQLKEVEEYSLDKEMFRSIELMLEKMKSRGWNQSLQDMYLCRKMVENIDWARKPLSRNRLAICDTKIQSQIAKDYIHELNDKYEAISKRVLSGDNLKSNDVVKDLSDGEQIFKKLIEPYKGKIILIDVWGTWCGPCKEDLSHSQEEYERLKPYDMVFMYLANGSPAESWKNVIKEYNVVGDNVVHFNLPTNQHEAVENYMKVKFWPTYKFVDQEGNLLDVNANPRDLNALENLIKKLTEKQ